MLLCMCEQQISVKKKHAFNPLPTFCQDVRGTQCLAVRFDEKQMAYTLQWCCNRAKHHYFVSVTCYYERLIHILAH